MRTLLIDADILVFRAAASNEQSIEWDPGTWTTTGDLDSAKQHVDSRVNELRNQLDADIVVMCLTDNKDPWRNKVLPSYKANRKTGGRPPLLLKPLREYVRQTYTFFQRPGLEADDILGILGTALVPPKPITGDRIICSIDKDLMTVPGQHYNWMKTDGVLEVSEEEADRRHLIQTLTGDTTDGYKGCPGVGPKSAEKILGETKGVAAMWPLVVSAFNKAGLTEQDALTQARVARICRASDYDFKDKKVILWQPQK
jgi:DNA polymerase-1